MTSTDPPMPPASPTEAEIAEARGQLIELAKALGRAGAEATHRLGADFDMDDPQVAREVMMATFEGLFLRGGKHG